LVKLFFWTATINKWYKFLHEDALKEAIVSSLKYFLYWLVGHEPRQAGLGDIAIL
jgi:hypothetical protein